MPQTNADNPKLASVLTEIGDLGQGTLTSLVLRKKGCVHGRGNTKLTYDDDFVQVLLWTGFHYQALIERSHQKLQALWSQGNLIHTLIQATVDAGRTDVTVQDAAEAVQETNDAYLRVLSEGHFSDSSESPTLPREGDFSPVWEPLKVNDQLVRGAKVYVGQGNPADPRSPKKGTIYIDGAKLGEKVLEPAPNGHWIAKQHPKTVAKDILRSWLPSGLYVRYCLDPESLLIVKVGAAAAQHAKEGKLMIDPEAIRSLFKVAA
jgi:hypothetical protein